LDIYEEVKYSHSVTASDNRLGSHQR
jgi:hypothetical protein